MKNLKIIVRKNEKKILPFTWICNDVLIHQDKKWKGNEFTVSAKLIGDGASLTIVGIFLGINSNAITFNTRVVHDAPNTKSLTTLRGVFKGHSLFNNDGLVRINKGAKGADGFFASKILLFDDAKGRSVPSLEIDENELKAGHASTVGRPDEQQLFYLRSRGLSEKDAEKLIVSGFFEPLLSLIPEGEKETIRKDINTIYEKL